MKLIKNPSPQMPPLRCKICLFSHRSRQCTCVHCIKKKKKTFSFFPQILLEFPTTTATATPPLWHHHQESHELKERRGGTAVEIPHYLSGCDLSLMRRQEMSYERQGRVLGVPAATNLHIEIK